MEKIRRPHVSMSGLHVVSRISLVLFGRSEDTVLDAGSISGILFKPVSQGPALAVLFCLHGGSKPLHRPFVSLFAAKHFPRDWLSIKASGWWHDVWFLRLEGLICLQVALSAARI